jgi:anthranilate phosphoribosyltransferase
MSEHHAFAKFIRALGRGATLSRTLEQEEAFDAMGLILAGDVEPIQLGAFLMLLRYRGETAEELAGFARAARGAMARPDKVPAIDLDWPSYADRHRQLPWFTLAALLLAENGVRILMHGIAGHSEGYAPTSETMARLGVRPSESLAGAAERLNDTNFAYITLDRFCPRLDSLFDLRPLFGLRSPVNTLARELNPLGAPYQLQGVFHPSYCDVHRRTAQLLGQPHCAVFKGGGGEVQRNPEKPCRVATLHDGACGDEEWPALWSGQHYPWRDETAEGHRIAALWRGELDAPAPEAAVIGTVALALTVMGRAATPATAATAARTMWDDRPRGKYGGGMAQRR